MNLDNLFERQSALEVRILERFPELTNEDLLPKKILSLQVELGELANEQRSWKFWSTRQIPVEPSETTRWLDGRCYTVIKHPLLEEYVDCLHFTLSIGLELRITNALHGGYNDSNIVDMFSWVFSNISRLNEVLEEQLEEIEIRAAYYDLIHSVLGLGKSLGFSNEQIEQGYISKNEENHTRQGSGY